MGDFVIPSSGGDDARPLILRDSSKADKGQEAELGAFNSRVVGIVTKTDGLGNIVESRDGFLEPRNWHERQGDSVPGYPNLPDRRYTTTIIADHQNGFGSMTTDDGSDPSRITENDWPASNKSTRFIDGSDPQGKVALSPSLIKVVDSLDGQYVAAIPLNRQHGSDKDDAHDTIAAGVVFDSAQNLAGLLDAIICVNEAESLGEGRDGTKTCPAAIRTTATYSFCDPQQAGDKNSAGATPDAKRHGPIQFDDTDASQMSNGRPEPNGTSVMGSMVWDAHFVVPPAWRPAFTLPTQGGGGGFNSAWYGDAYDGDLTLSASNLTPLFEIYKVSYATNYGTGIPHQFGYEAGGSPPPDGQYLVFTHRALYFHNFTVPAGFTLYPIAPIYCTGTLTADGEISASGNGVNVWRIGAGVPGIFVTGGAVAGLIGGTGGTGGNNANGNDGNPGNPPYDERDGGAAGTPPGNGGDAGGNLGGSGSHSGERRMRIGDTVPGLGVGTSSPAFVSPQVAIQLGGLIGGGSGGGGGAGSASSLGGNGGNGGGVIFIAARTVAGGGVLSADGQDGYEGFGLTDPGGGGGGGNPGTIIVMSDNAVTISTRTNPGVGGSGVGGASNGQTATGTGYVKFWTP